MAGEYHDLYTGDGIETQFTITFSYISRAHVFVTIDGTLDTTFTWVSDTVVQPTSTPADGAAVRVFRSTPITTQYSAFRDSSILTENQLNNADSQLLYGLQERLGYNDDADALDAVNLIINNVETPAGDQALANKAYVDDEIAAALAAFTIEPGTIKDTWRYVPSSRKDLTAQSPVGIAEYYDLEDGWDYMFLMRNWVNSFATSFGGFQFRTSTDTGTSPTFNTSTAFYMMAHKWWAPGISFSNTETGASHTQGLLSHNRYRNSPQHARMELYNFANASKKTIIRYQCWGRHSAGGGGDLGYGLGWGEGYLATAAADKAIQLRWSYDNTVQTAGTVDLYKREVQS